MNYMDIKPNDVNNGNGVCVSLWVAGCERHCKNCHNPQAWDKNAGRPFNDEAFEYLQKLFNEDLLNSKNLSILGGEPLQDYNYSCVETILKWFKEAYPNRKTFVWTGYDYEAVKDLGVMKYIDNLITGEFIDSLKETDTVKYWWRGSSNQEWHKPIEDLKMCNVSVKEQKDMNDKIRGFELVSTPHYKEDLMKLPVRGSKESAGYDLVAPHDICIRPNEQVLVWTNVKAYMQKGEVLKAYPRSSFGVKKNVMLANTVGIIDADYYSNPDNEGNIGVCLRNMKPSIAVKGTVKIFNSATEDEDGNYVVQPIEMPLVEDLTIQNTIHIKKGERFAQLIFSNYLQSDNCNSEDLRTSGFGSTDNK